MIQYRSGAALILLALLLILTGCAGSLRENGESESEAVETALGDEENMRHEIVRVDTITAEKLTLVNYKGERYVVTPVPEASFRPEPDQRVGISYTEKTCLEDGTYVLKLVRLTNEGDGTVRPYETTQP